MKTCTTSRTRLATSSPPARDEVEAWPPIRIDRRPPWLVRRGQGRSSRRRREPPPPPRAQDQLDGLRDDALASVCRSCWLRRLCIRTFGWRRCVVGLGGRAGVAVPLAGGACGGERGAGVAGGGDQPFRGAGQSRARGELSRLADVLELLPPSRRAAPRPPRAVHRHSRVPCTCSVVPLEHGGGSGETAERGAARGLRATRRREPSRGPPDSGVLVVIVVVQ